MQSPAIRPVAARTAQMGGDDQGGSGGGVPLFWIEERRQRAKLLLNDNTSQQINWDDHWAVGSHVVTLDHGGGFASPVPDANLAGFYSLPGTGISEWLLNFGPTDWPIIQRPKNSAWYVATYVYIRGQFKAPPKFVSALQLSDPTHNDTIEITSDAANGPFHFFTFVGGVLKQNDALTGIGKPGTHTCPIGAGFTVAVYNDPRNGVMGVEFNDVPCTGFPKFVIDAPNKPVGLYVYNSADDQAAISVAAAYCAQERA